MSLENLKENIRENTEKEIKNIKEETNAKIIEINKKTDEEIKTIDKDTKRFIELESKRLIEEYTSNADLRARNMIEEAKQNVIDKEYNKIKSNLINELTNSEKYTKIIKNAINEAIKKLGETKFTLFIYRKYKKNIENSYPNIKIKENENKMVLIKSNDDKITIDISPDKIVEMYSSEIKKKIYELLLKNNKENKNDYTKINKKLSKNKKY
jgi:vacuolar-type H+-ATPase subunit E/Vma4